MTDRGKGYNEHNEVGSLAPREEAGNEVVIIIRDGKVVTFIQKDRNVPLEGMYGDGI
ncbi:hypothetical protein [Sporomusa rhizae]|uniref:hypothetical protein n=1 Tax=Sporomusa rhizae TaxID=357999 RepID=UPI00352A76D9